MKKIFFLIINFLSFTAIAMEPNSNDKSELFNTNSENGVSSTLSFERLYLSFKKLDLEKSNSAQNAMMDAYFNLSEKDRFIALQYLIENKIYLIGINDISKQPQEQYFHNKNDNSLSIKVGKVLEIIRAKVKNSKSNLGLFEKLMPDFETEKTNSQNNKIHTAVQRVDLLIFHIISFLTDPNSGLKQHIQDLKALAHSNSILGSAVLNYLGNKFYDLSQMEVSINISAALSHLSLLKMFHACGFSLSYKDRFGTTPLMYAALCNAKVATKYLLEQGVDREEHDDSKSKWTALNYALANDNLEVAQILKENNLPKSQN